MKKRILSLVLCLCLTLTLLPTGAAATEHPDHDTATALSGSMDSCKLNANTNYYLSGDLTLTGNVQGITVLSGKVNLCLNGHTITDSRMTEAPLFYVNKGATLNIYDCKGGGTVHSRYRSDVSGTLHLYGGTLTGAVTSVYGYDAQVMVKKYGTLIMEDGVTIYNSSACAVNVQEGGTLTVNGGSITYSKSYKGVLTEGTVNMSGGTVNNGVHVKENGSFTMSGGIVNNGVSICIKEKPDEPDGGNGSFTMTGGGVGGTENGVNVGENGSFTMTGGYVNTNSSSTGYAAVKIAGTASIGSGAEITTSNSQPYDLIVGTGTLNLSEAPTITSSGNNHLRVTKGGTINAADYTGSKLTVTLNSYSSWTACDTVIAEGNIEKFALKSTDTYTLAQSGSALVLDSANFTATVNLHKDSEAWADSGKTLALYQSGEQKYTLSDSNTGVYTATGVAPGTYDVYDDGADTGIDVTDDTAVTVDYYTVTYNSGAGTGTLPETATVRKGTSYPVSTAKPLTRDGFTQSGWNTSEGTTSFTSINNVSAAQTLYPAWALIPHTQSHAATYNGESVTNNKATYTQGGDLVLSVEVNHALEDEAGFTIEYQWYKGGTEEKNKLTGATGASYTIVDAAAGNYSDYYVSTRCTYDEISDSTATESFPSVTIEAATPDAPSAPTSSGKTYNSISMTSVSEQKYICLPASAATPTTETSGWQDSGVFTNLAPNMEYKIYTYRPAADANYTASPVSAALSVTTDKAKITDVTAPGNTTLTAYYITGDGAKAGLAQTTASTSEDAVNPGLAVTWTPPTTYDATPGATNNFTWSVVAPDNYEFATGVTATGSITVTNKAATAVSHTVVSTNCTKPFAGATLDVTDMFTLDANAGSATYSMTPVTGTGIITEAGALTVTKAGTFTIKVETAANGNYAAGTESATLTVSKGTGVGSVSMNGWTYGAGASSPTPTSATNGIGSVTYSYGGVSPTVYEASNTPPTDAGSYKVTATFAETDLYHQCSDSAAFSIAKALVSFTVSGNTHDYDGTTHIAVVAQTENETPSAAGKFTVRYQKDSETPTENRMDVGEYKIIVALTDDNLQFDGQTETVRSIALTDKLTINKVFYPNASTITIPTAGSLTYGQKLSDSVLTGGDTGFAYEWKVGSTIPTVTNSGYAVVCTPKNTNYDAFERTATVTVSPATPSLTLPTAAAITYGQTLENSTLTGGSAGAAYNGVANANVSGAYSWSAKTTAPQVSDSNLTEYEVTFTPTDTENYNTAKGKVQLTVNPKPVTLTWDYKTPFTYNGGARTVTASVTNKVGESDAFSLSYTGNVKTDAGSYAAEVTGLGNGNYTMSGATGTKLDWVIQKAPISFTVTENMHTYDNTAKTADVAQTAGEKVRIDGSKFSVSYKLPADADAAGNKTAVGVYDVIVTLSDSNFCFEGATAPTDRSDKVGTLTISRDIVTILWLDATTVYDGGIKFPQLELSGLKSGDAGRVSARLTERISDAGTHAVTAELYGEAAGNYDIANPNGTLIIQKAPVSFTVFNDSVRHDGGAHTAAATSSPDVRYSVTYRNAKGEAVSQPTDVGQYDIYAAIESPNYRHAGAANGAARKIGVLTIYAASAPAVYTVSFDANGGAGTVDALTAAQAGTVRVLPDCGFTNSGKHFAGWQYSGKVYHPGSTLSQPASNSTLKALWVDSAYSVGGTVNANGAPASDVVVTLMLGSEPIAQTKTDAQGAYSFQNILPGIYNLVANKDGVTQTILVAITGNDMPDQQITMPEGKLNSIVEVRAGTPAIVVGNLEVTFTAEDIAESATKVVDIRLTAEAMAADGENTDHQEIMKKAGSSVGLYLDMTLTKSVDGIRATLTSSPVLLTAVISLPAALQGKDNYTVYRMHNGVLETLTTAPNADGEKIELNAHKTVLTVYAKYFSTYAVAGTTYSNGGTTHDSITLAEGIKNGSVTVSGKSAGAGNTVSITAVPDEGYVLKSILVTGSDGKSISCTAGKDGKYFFMMPSRAVTISVKFEKAEGLPFADVDENDWFCGDVAYVFEHGLMQGTADDKFSPHLTTTRGMIVTILYRLEDEPAVTGACPFDDVATGKYYEKAIIWGAANGIVEGYGNSKFGPDDNITREQMGAILWRYAKYKDYDVTASADLSKFSDEASISVYAKTALSWANANEIITGKGGGILDPKGNAERCQVAAILHRFIVASK